MNQNTDTRDNNSSGMMDSGTTNYNVGKDIIYFNYYGYQIKYDQRILERLWDIFGSQNSSYPFNFILCRRYKRTDQGWQMISQFILLHYASVIVFYL